MTAVFHKSSLLLMTVCLLQAALAGAGHAAVTLTEVPIREAVVAHVQEKLKTLVSADDARYVTVDVVKVPAAPFQFPHANRLEEITINADSSLGNLYSERAVVRVSMSTPDGQHREIGVPVRIIVKKPVWVVKNAINARQPLKVSDFQMQVREVSHTYGSAVGAERKLGDYIARVNLRPGEVLDARKIVRPPDVTNNHEIRILMTNGQGMTVTVPGIALADGRIGETIRVRQTLRQRKAYTAKIIDKNRVLVEI